jgi:hypothetical protein
MRPGQWQAGLLLCAMALAGCAFPTGDVRVHIENGTDAPVAVYVNGGWVGTYPGGTTTSAPIAGHGGPPYTVVSEGAGGAVLTTTVIAANDAASVASGSTVVESSLDVGCGHLRIVIATAPAYAATSFTELEACP